MADIRLLRIGVLGTEGANPRTSHIYAQWAPLLNPPRGFGRRTGMVITHVWDKERAVAEGFAKLYGNPKVVDRYDAMAGEVDGVIQSGYKGSFWAYELVRPYLEAGIPVYIDRPGAYSLTGVRRLVDLAAKHNCLLMVSNNHENNRTVDLLQERANALGPLTGVLADSLTDREMLHFSMHCIHGWFMLYPVLAGMVRRVRTYVAGGAFPSPVTLMECENADHSPFTAALMRHRSVHRGWVKLFGRSGTYEGTVLPPATYKLRQALARVQLANDSPDTFVYLLTDFSLPVMTKFERMIAARKMPQSYSQIVEKVQVFLASFRSLLEEGRAYDLRDFDAAWTAPNPYPGYFPDNYFPRS